MHHQQQTQIMPGNTSYADMVKKGKNFTILGDSITVGIKQIERNKHSKGNIHLKTFREATCTDMLSYVQPTLDTTKSDGIIIHVGTNDVSANRKRLSDIANSIISVGKKCWDTGVRNIMISSLVHRKSLRFQAKINEVNDVLRYFCDNISLLISI